MWRKASIQFYIHITYLPNLPETPVIFKKGLEIFLKQPHIISPSLSQKYLQSNLFQDSEAKLC